MKILVCLSLLVAVAAASLSEDLQSFNLQSNTVLRYKNTNLLGYKVGYKKDAKILVEPYVAFRLLTQQPIRRSVFGDGYYVKLPIYIKSSLSLSSNYTVMKLRSFSVSLRPGFASWCSAKCPGVSVSAIRTSRGSSVLLRCRQRSVCKKILNSLYFNTPDTDVVRKAFKFKFATNVDGTKFFLTKKGLPVNRATRMPLKDSFWFEGNKLLLYTVKANSGYSAYQTFVKDMGYRLPVDGSWPDVYRSPLLDKLAKAIRTSANWEIVAEMRKDDKMVSQLVFDVSKNRNSINNVNWFSESRLKSSYPYWVSTSKFNFFSVVGDVRYHRRFFVNRRYNGCAQDTGFWCVSDGKDPCPWSKNGWKGRAPVLVYNMVQGVRYQGGRVGYADRFLVYMRYNSKLTPSINPFRKAFKFEPGRLLLYTIKNKVGMSIYSTFTKPGNNKIPRDGQLPPVYRSNYLDELSTVASSTGKRYIVLEMRKGRSKVVQLKFDITKNSRSLRSTNWFTKSRLVYSYPYNIRNKKFNFFSVAGHVASTINRRFFVNYAYGGCPGDKGFMVALDRKDVCTWANKFWNGRAPSLLYNPTPGTLWKSGVREADRLLVYLQ